MRVLGRLLVVGALLGGCGGAQSTVDGVAAADPGALLPTFLTEDAPAAAVVTLPAPEPVALPEAVFPRTHRAAIAAVAVGPRLAVAVGVEGSVSLIDVQSGALRAARRFFTSTSSARRVELAPGEAFALVTSDQSGPRELDTVLVWDLRTGRASVLNGAAPGTAHVARISPAGDAVAFAERDAEDRWHLRVWDAATETVRADAVLDDHPEFLLWAPAADAVCAIGTRGGLELVDARTGEVRAYRPATDPSIALDAPPSGEPVTRWLDAAWRPTGGALALTDARGFVTIVAPRALEVRQRIEAGFVLDETPFVGAVRALWSADGASFVVFRPGRGTVKRYDGVTGALEREFAVAGPNTWFDVAYSDDALLVLTRETGLTRFAADGAEGAPFESTTSADLEVFAATVDGHHVATGSPDGTVRILDGRTGEKLAQVDGGAGEHSVWGFRFRPDGGAIAIWGRSSGDVWSAQGVTHPRCLQGEEPADWSADGASLRIGGQGACDPSTGTVTPAQGGVLACATGPRGVCVRSASAGLELVPATGAARPRPLPQSADVEPTSLRFTADGARLIAGADDGVRIWDTRSARLVAGPLDATPLLWSTAGDRAVLDEGDHRRVSLVDVLTGRMLAMLVERAEGDPDPEATSRSAFSASGRLLATVHLGALVLRDARTGATLGRVAAPDGGDPVFHVSDTPWFVADDAVAVTSFDRVRVYGVPDLRERTSYSAGEPLHFETTPDGRTLVSCVHERTLRVLDAATGALRRELDAPCDGTTLDTDAAGRIVAWQRATEVWIARLDDGQVLRLRTYRDDAGAHSIAQAPSGSLVAEGDTVDLLDLREAGDVRTAPLLALVLREETTRFVRPALLSEFFAPRR